MDNPDPIQQADGIIIASRTDVGLRRSENQDHLVVERLDTGLLLVVCDGMGGHAGGRVASYAAAEAFVEAFRIAPEPGEEAIHRALLDADRRVGELARDRPELAGMGTTIVVAYVKGANALVAHVGDSRAYLSRSGILQRMTDDHSAVFEMMRRGEISEAEAEKHPRRNIITRAVDGGGTVRADLQHLLLLPGDRLLLCTDGLNCMIGDHEIASILNDGQTPQRICDALVDAALEAGGNDNVTVLLAVVDHDGRGGLFNDNPVTNPVGFRPAERKWWHGISGWGPMALVFSALAIAVAVAWMIWFQPDGSTGLDDSTAQPSRMDSVRIDSTPAPAAPPWEQAGDSVTRGVADTLHRDSAYSAPHALSR